MAHIEEQPLVTGSTWPPESPVTGPVTVTDITLESVENTESSSFFNRTRRFFSRNYGKLAVAAATASIGGTLVVNPMEDTIGTLREVAPEVGTGIAASEIAFCAGAAMMVVAVGDKIGNPLKIKSKIKDIATKAKSSKLFWAGFVVNTTGAVGDFAVLSVPTVRELPPSSWGILGLTLTDLGLTYFVRKSIIKGVKANAEEPLAEAA